MKYTDKQFPDIYKHTKNNELDILQSKTCSCLFCQQNYSARKVSEWNTDKNNQMSAVCPECGMDAVVGDASGYVLDDDDIETLHKTYFGEKYMAQHPDCLDRYIARYRQGKMVHTVTAQNTYLTFLEFQSRMGNPDAAFYIGEFFEFGSEFTKIDLTNAFYWYSSPSLSFDAEALTRLGVVEEKMEKYEMAYESYAKAMSLGSIFGLLHFSDCYMNGHWVAKDRPFACKILFDAFLETYARFIMGDAKDSGAFSSLCYRLGKAYEKGYGLEKDNMEALHLYLFADYGYSLLKEKGYLHGDLIAESKYVTRRINAIAKMEGFQKGEPLFDLDTFLSSLVCFGGAKDVYDLYLPCVMHPSEFDSASGTFSLTVSYPRPQLIVDIPNLFCDFVDGDITWNFDHVTGISGFEEGKAYNRVVGDGENSLRFFNTFMNPQELVGEIRFDHTDKIDANHSKKA